MVYLKTVITVCFFINVFGLRREMCEITDEECLTTAVRQHVFQMFVGGLPRVESSERLHLVSVVIDQPHFKNKLNNATLSGIKNCVFIKLKINRQNNTFDYELLCPDLTIKSDYEVMATIDTDSVEGKGPCQITYNNYHITILGSYDKVIDENGKLHFNITEHNFLLDLQGGVTYSFQNLLIVDQEKREKHTKAIEELSRLALMEEFLEQFVQHLKVFLIEVPIDDLHFRYVI